MDYSKLFTSKRIGSMEVKNRYVMPAMGTSFGELSGEPSRKTIDYYTERAKGGFGLIIVEVTGVAKDGICTPGQLGLWSDEFNSSWKKLVDSVHAYDAKIAVQIQHAGRQTSPALIGHQPVSSSAVACPVFDIVPKAMTLDEIWDTIEQFGDAAKRAKDVGFDAVEVHGAHGYLVAQFLSSQVNKRFDEFGGSIKGRAKFACEIIKNIKKKCGEDFPVLVRISGDEKMPGALNISDTKQIVKYLEDAGADAIHCSICTYGSLEYMFMPADTPSGFNAVNAKELKESIEIPVIAVGRLNTPEIQEDVIRTEKADFVALGRESIADPDFPNKVKSGAIDEISPCISCLQSCAGYLMNPEKLKISCLVNPRTGHEGEYTYEKAKNPKKVVIIGAGPAGLEAAWISAKKGHDVTVYEQSDMIGGQFRIGALPPTKHLLNGVLKYYYNMCQKYGVNIVLNAHVDEAFIKEQKPDAVILATGGKPLHPDIEGINNPNVVDAIDVLDAKVTVGRNCLIAGGGMVGAETADFLREHNRTSTIIDMRPDIAMDTFLGVRSHLINRLNDAGTQYLMNAKIIAFTKDGVTYEQDGMAKTIGGFDNIILALGVKSNNVLEEKIRSFVDEVYVIGDAVKPGQANAATEAGIKVACSL